jgi:pimeloyl-ACP methyl ester carboxylesterase
MFEFQTGGPAWFSQALSHRSIERECDSAGTAIRYRSWNAADTGKPAVLFVHGFRAHSRWWDFIAPQLSATHRVFALDFAGMGDSGFRRVYTTESFTQDILSVIAAEGMAPVVLIGHSFGGWQVLRACAHHAEYIAKAIVLDSLVLFAADSRSPPRRWGRALPYPDRASILARYRLLPEQPAEPYLRHYVAAHSIRQVDDGWRWKFDPLLSDYRTDQDGDVLLPAVGVPVAYVCGELSAVVSPRRAALIAAALPRETSIGPIILPGTYHHLMLDQPQLLMQTLGDLLRSDWC